MLISYRSPVDEQARPFVFQETATKVNADGRRVLGAVMLWLQVASLPLSRTKTAAPPVLGQKVYQEGCEEPAKAYLTPLRRWWRFFAQNYLHCSGGGPPVALWQLVVSCPPWRSANPTQVSARMSLAGKAYDTVNAVAASLYRVRRNSNNTHLCLVVAELPPDIRLSMIKLALGFAYRSCNMWSRTAR